jgi:hypothetical protein
MGTAPGGPPTTSQFVTARVSKNENAVSVSLSGGIPVIDEKIPTISHLQFVGGGSGDDTYKSNGEKGSVAGVHLSVLSPTLNVENVEVGGTKITTMEPLGRVKLPSKPTSLTLPVVIVSMTGIDPRKSITAWALMPVLVERKSVHGNNFRHKSMA